MAVVRETSAESVCVPLAMHHVGHAAVPLHLRTLFYATISASALPSPFATSALTTSLTTATFTTVSTTWRRWEVRKVGATLVVVLCVSTSVSTSTIASVSTSTIAASTIATPTVSATLAATSLASTLFCAALLDCFVHYGSRSLIYCLHCLHCCLCSNALH